MNDTYTKEKIAVAVSGGADSLFTLMQLREQGADLVALHGIFFQPRDKAETADKQAVLEGLAQNCEALGVALTVADLSSAFLELVIRPFVEAYAQGLTPNPCALCNARIKFGLLQDFSLSLGADRIATGHYARLVRQDCALQTTETRQNGGIPGQELSGCATPALLQGRDPIKDQSYFLALTPAGRLAKALFPLGERNKKDVLSSLAARGIAIPQPTESQEVCFVPNDAYRDFLPRVAESLGIPLPGPGPMLLADGRRLGTHKGLWQYTEGQRKGLGLGWTEPLHVLGKEKKGNILRLGPRHEMRVDGCECPNANILLPPRYWPPEVLVKTRYREKPKPAIVRMGLEAQDAAMHIRFLQPDTAVAPGQVAAVYIPTGHGEPLRLVAGGIIGAVL